MVLASDYYLVTLLRALHKETEQEQVSVQGCLPLHLKPLVTF